jgi:alpha-ketoglutaric semialdehyde dehydrogenase
MKPENHHPCGRRKDGAPGNAHREAGTAAIEFYSEWKTLYIDYSDRLQRAQIDAGDLA